MMKPYMELHVYKKMHKMGCNNDSKHQQFSEHVQLALLSSRSVSTVTSTIGLTRTKIYYQKFVQNMLR